MVVVNDYWALSKIRADRSEVVLNTYQAMPGSFTRNTDMQFPANDIIAAIKTALGDREPMLVDANELAMALIGDAIATNLFMLGYAWQKGLVPISHEALMRAIELNGAAVEMNRKAFNWGRMAVHDLAVVKQAAGIGAVTLGAPSGANESATASAFIDNGTITKSLDETIALRVKFLTEYQDAAYAQQYQSFVEKIRSAENRHMASKTGLSEATAKYLFKLMAYKDEYEVARLYTTGDFEKRIKETFDGDFKIKFNLAPPMFSKKDSNGHLIKQEYGSWIFTAFKIMTKLKGLRGGAFDIFGKTEERKMERQLIVDYRNTIEELINSLNSANYALAVEIAKVPEHIRGYGHVKEQHFAKAKARKEDLLLQWRNPEPDRAVA